MGRQHFESTRGSILSGVRRVEMKNNEYNAAEVVEIGPAHEIVLGDKVTVPDLDSTGMEPIERHYRE
jgi:hypothetical protein